MDGEDTLPADEALQQHLRGCGACRRWQAEAARLNRMLRLAPAAPPHERDDLAERILATVELPRRRRWPVLLRPVLAVVALAQLAIGAANLARPLGLDMGMPSSTHMAHEVAAFNLAFGIALVAIACNPRHARTQVPVLGSFLLVLTAASIADLTTGTVGWSRLATHAPILLGLLLATLLTRQPPSPTVPATRRRAHGPVSGPDPHTEPDPAGPVHGEDPPSPAAATQHEAAQRRSA